MNAKTGRLYIQTPEGITVSLTLAGPTTRFLAWIVDQFCIVALGQTSMLLVVWLGMLGAEYVIAGSMVAYFCVSIGYPIALEWLWRGQTLGKRLLRLRVVDEQGLRLQFSQIVVRNLLRFVDALPLFYLLGGVASFLSAHAQRLGDLAANTVVIRERQFAEPDLDELLAGKYNSFRAYPHIEARLRQRATPEEARVALQALVRRNDLDPNARVELFADLAAHFRELAAFPEEASLGLTDEQYIRNVVDVLFRSRGPAAQGDSPVGARKAGQTA